MQCMDVSLARSSQPAQLSTLHTCDILRLSVFSSTCQYPNFGARRHGLTLPISQEASRLHSRLLPQAWLSCTGTKIVELVCVEVSGGSPLSRLLVRERHGSIDSALSMMRKFPNKLPTTIPIDPKRDRGLTMSHISTNICKMIGAISFYQVIHFLPCASTKLP